MTRDVFATVLNALSNASRTPVSKDDVLAILVTGDGPGNLVRALFGDCSLETLDRLGQATGFSRSRIKASYRNAKRLHAAANADMDGAP